MSELPAWLEVAENEIGVHEIPGIESNKRILEYFKATALTATNDEIPWCSAFVNWCILSAGINGTHSARARSWMSWGAELKTPKLGCIVVFSRGNNPDQGHVGFFIEEINGFYKILSGNQRDSVCYALFPKMHVLANRWPDPKKSKG